VIHAWDKVRIDDYLAIEKLTALTGDHPEYLGWVALERVLNEKPRVQTLVTRIPDYCIVQQSGILCDQTCQTDAKSILN
jgi:hypothetical protein